MARTGKVRCTAAVIATVGVVVAVAAGDPAAAQDDGAPIEVVEADRMGCEIAGAQALCDGFYWGSADAVFGDLGTGQEGVQLDLSADFDSTFWLEVAEQQVTGDWQITGTWNMGFSGSVSGVPIDGQARVSTTGGGTAAGSATAFSVSGTEHNSGVAELGGSTQTISNSGPLQPVEVEVTGGNCIEVLGEWRMSWSALAAEVGWTGTDTISGEFTALRQVQYDLEVANDLIARAGDDTLAAADIDSANLPDTVKDMVRAVIAENELIRFFAQDDVVAGDTAFSAYLKVLAEHERIAAEAKNAGACEAEILGGLKQLITGWPASTAGAIAVAVADHRDEVSGDIVRQITEAVIRTGALGEGSALDDDRRQEIDAALRGSVEQILERNTTLNEEGALATSDLDSEREQLEAARAAVLLGGDFDVHGVSSGITQDYVDDADPAAYKGGTWGLEFLFGPKSLTLEVEE